MEIIGGVHDPELWARQSKKYFKNDDPLYPCSSEFMPDEARSWCYVYLTPHLFVSAGADLAGPTAVSFEKAFTFCEKIPTSDVASRNMCYGGFGKEFVVLAQNRDIRNIEGMTDEQLTQIYDRCLLAKKEEGIVACIQHAVNSLYWGGENDRSVAIRFCGLVSDTAHQRPCFTNLIGAVSHYGPNPDYKKAFCEELPAAYREDCRAGLVKESVSPDTTFSQPHLD